jgi:hypothetical protein
VKRNARCRAALDVMAMSALSSVAFLMTEPFTPEYHFDGQGRRVLRGLTYEETVEFEKLDASLPFGGTHVWPDPVLPVLPMEARWRELWDKHQAALASKRA